MVVSLKNRVWRGKPVPDHSLHSVQADMNFFLCIVRQWSEDDVGLTELDLEHLVMTPAAVEHALILAAGRSAMRTIVLSGKL